MLNGQPRPQFKARFTAFRRFPTLTHSAWQPHYEQYPYPRWLNWEFDPPGARIQRAKKFFKPAELNFLDRPFDVLVAGCGTGSKAIQYAIAYGAQARVLAVISVALV
ncbi:MAG: hypothetical protein R3F37_13290 [Candidatus Competibacteraceae bacterium]